MSASGDFASPTEEIDAMIEQLADWRGRTLSQLRNLIREAVPEVTEDVKWRQPSNDMTGVPVWSHEGIICTGEIYRNKVKLTFMKGALLDDPEKLFNSSLGGNTRRAIDFSDGDEVDGGAFRTLIAAAAQLNSSA